MENVGLALPWRMNGGERSGVGEFCLGRSTEKWVKHYSSFHRILIVGDGDFSFSLSLAVAFGSAFNIVATSLDSYDTLVMKYSRARSNLEQLRALGANILHRVNATQMKHHIQLCNCQFDRIVFNFPHAGFYGREDNPDMIKMHQALIRDFFRNAWCLLHSDGEIHISHKNSPPYCHWNLEELARENSLCLIESVPFNISDYPLYQNKRGHGDDSDDSFHLGNCSTFKFVASHPSSYLETPVILKFMVKGFIGSFYKRTAEYVGVLVNPKNSILAVISGPLPEVEPDTTELLAIKEALSRFGISKWCGKVGLVVENDSRNAVSWIKSDMGNPWNVQRVIKDIRMAIGHIGNVDVRCSHRQFGVEIELRAWAHLLG